MSNQIEVTFTTWHKNITLMNVSRDNDILFTNVLPEPNGSTRLTVKGDVADVYNFVTQLNLDFGLIVNADR